ncbi:MAG: aldo/keto reductase [Clostridia bacterium]|nr:aldo/keto reductase [Clostridia bacterium]
MHYSYVKGLDKKVSKMVFGTATPLLFTAVAPGATKADEDAAFALLDNVFAHGINTFDCASHYGEEIMGRWMQARGNRDECVIITKCAHPNKWRDRVTEFDILSDAHDSLAKLRTDKIDLYMLHRDSHTYPVEKIVETLNTLHKEGKIAAFGGSNWTCERIAAANKYAAENGLVSFTLSSPNFGLAEQINDPWISDAKFADGCVTISGPENEENRKWYADNSIPVFAYSSLARGFFSGAFSSAEPEKAKEIMDEPGILGYYCENNLERLARCEKLAAKYGVTVPQIAMAWIYNQPMDVFAICAPINNEQLESNIAAMELTLTKEELDWLDLK